MKTWSKPTAGNASTPSGASNLNDLSDVVISTPQANQILKYDGTTFINSEVPGLDDIQASFNNLNADNLTTGTLNPARLPNLAGIVLSGDAVPPYISSITPPITASGEQTIEITGEYFTPITNLNIPGVTVNTLQVRSPNKIIANISKSGLSGNTQITLANGGNTNQIWAEGIKSVSIFADPYWANVVFFLKGDGENNSPNIIDTSSSPKIISRFGDTKISTAQSKYGGSSILFDGAGDYLLLNNYSDTLSDFTIEAWFFLLASSWNGCIASNGSNNFNIGAINNLGKYRNQIAGVDKTSTITIPLNQWIHYAVVRSGATIKTYINGINNNFFDSSSSTAISFNNNLYIGSHNATLYFMNGYIDSLRITKAARYTANFSPELDTYLNI